MRVQPFGKDPSGLACSLFVLKGTGGAEVSVTDWGAHIVSIRVPNKSGKLHEVCLGQDSAEKYAAGGIGYMGATVGRYGNRIGGASFELNGESYQVGANEGPNMLHGGHEGFDQRLWACETEGDQAMVMRYVSPHLEEGFPGELKVSVRFSLDEQNSLRIDYQAVSDRDTQVNLTNHAYFNLSDEADILGHTLQVAADRYVWVGEDLIPTGDMPDVTGTPYDLRQPVLLGDMLRRRDHPMFAHANGYDVGFVLNGHGMRQVAVLRDTISGRTMRVLTDQPGLQCYSGQGMEALGHHGRRYGRFSGIALETQQHPDTVHHPQFGSTLLKAGDTYKTSTMYAFD